MLRFQGLKYKPHDVLPTLPTDGELRCMFRTTSSNYTPVSTSAGQFSLCLRTPQNNQAAHFQMIFTLCIKSMIFESSFSLVSTSFKFHPNLLKKGLSPNTFTETVLLQQSPNINFGLRLRKICCFENGLLLVQKMLIIIHMNLKSS